MDIRTAWWEDGRATFVTGAGEPSVGDSVTVEGVDPEGYDGAFVLVACTTGTCSVELEDDPGEYVSGGTITKED